ncbi:MAG TPA: hypothetical protein VNX86_13445 [Rhizomicrobium sp.]|nr:hypothetical protein [Rhizomicrobium sp.]
MTVAHCKTFLRENPALCRSLASGASAILLSMDILISPFLQLPNRSEQNLKRPDFVASYQKSNQKDEQNCTPRSAAGAEP